MDPERNRFARQRAAGGYVFLQEPEGGEEEPAEGEGRREGGQAINVEASDGGPEEQPDGGPGDAGGDGSPADYNGDAGEGE